MSGNGCAHVNQSTHTEYDADGNQWLVSTCDACGTETSRSRQ